MIIRLDKCCCYGMMKVNGTYGQFEPALYINNGKMPSVALGESFKYLGKLYDFNFKNELAKTLIIKKLTDYLFVTSKLKIKVQLKIKVLKQYIYSQLRFELKIYNFGATWINENLDSVITKHVRDWLQMPISSCVKEMMTLPANKLGLSLPTLKYLSEQMWLQKRNTLKNSKSPDIFKVWSDSSVKNVKYDSLLQNTPFKTATATLKNSQIEESATHFYSLPIQGIAAKTVNENIPKAHISIWASNLNIVSGALHNFAKKALQQQLPTLGNLYKWKRVSEPSCPLCANGFVQTNKHVLSNCNSVIALNRYTQRHNAVLVEIANWINNNRADTQHLFVDIDSGNFKPISDVFLENVRPDLVIVQNSSIIVLELTVCHETNLLKSKLYKLEKYKELYKFTKIPVQSTHIFSIEVSTLGFISNISKFLSCANLPKLPKTLVARIANLTLTYSFDIYRKRNSPN